ncbi:MAG: DUF2892 domain-containing protein [Bacteroidia bacterium]
MKSNAGIADRFIRVYLGMVIAGSGIFYNSIWAVLGIPVFISGIVGFCPLYSLLKLNTFGKEDAEV